MKLEANNLILGKAQVDDIDIVICSKDREELAKKQIKRVKQNISYNQLILMDSSEIKYKISEKKVTHIHTPNYKLGTVRASSYNMCTSKLLLVLDDDIVFDANSLENLKHCLLSDEKNVAVSGIVVNGYPHYPIIMKLYEHGRSCGYSMGFSLFLKEKMDALGGFLGDIHIGEDIILAHKIRKSGYKWNRCKSSKVYHITNGWLHEFKRALRNTSGIMDIWKVGGLNIFHYLLTSLGRFILMPFYYAFKTREIKIYFLYLGISFMKLSGNIYHLLRGFRSWIK